VPVIVGGVAPALTVIVTTDDVPVAPMLSVTVSETWYVPGIANAIWLLAPSDASPFPNAFALLESVTEYAYVYGGVPEVVELANVTFWPVAIAMDVDAVSVIDGGGVDTVTDTGDDIPVAPVLSFAVSVTMYVFAAKNVMVLPTTDASPLLRAFALLESFIKYAYVYGGVPEAVRLVNVTFWPTMIAVDPEAVSVIDSGVARACTVPDRSSIHTAANTARPNRFDMTYPLYR
jgi:hypothetical protein